MTLRPEQGESRERERAEAYDQAAGGVKSEDRTGRNIHHLRACPPGLDFKDG